MFPTCKQYLSYIVFLPFLAVGIQLLSLDGATRMVVGPVKESKVFHTLIRIKKLTGY